MPGGRVASNAVWLAMAASLLAIALVGVAFPHVHAPLMLPLVPAMLLITALTDLATAVVLLAMSRPLPAERGLFLLAIVFGGSSVFAFALFLIVPMWPWGAQFLRDAPQAMPWLFVLWHGGTALAAIGYARLRGAATSRLSRRAFRAVAVASIVVYVGLALIATFVFAHHLPVLASGTSLGGLRTSGVGIGLMVLATLAAWHVLRVREPSEIDRAVALAVAAIVLGLALNLGGNERYALSWYLARLTFCLSSLFVLGTAVATLVRSRTALFEAAAALEHSQGESALRADRLRALAALSSDVVQSEDAYIQSILHAATSTLRPGTPTCGFLSHIDGGTLVVDAVEWSGGEQQIATLVMSPGAVFALERTIFGNTADEPSRRAWDDLATVVADGMICHELGWHSLIFAPLTVGRRPYFLTFAFSETMAAQPFAEDDVVYVDVLASFVARRFTERQHLERIQYQVEHDPLTGLKNRAQFRVAVRRAAGVAEPFAVAYVDIDDFREFNEANGHLIGDELLVEVAMELAALDERDYVARLSGDDFAIVLGEVGSADDAHQRLARYADMFATPFHTGDREGTRRVSISASIGAALFPRDGSTADDMIRAADVALDAAKERGGGAVVLFDTAMAARAQRVQIKSRELAAAIDAGGLALDYQPTFDLATRSITGAEALVRWHHPERGVIPPAEFIEFAERNGLIGRISRWVMKRVLADLAMLPALPPGFRCYFNLASAQIDDLAFIGDLEARLLATPRLAEHLGIEITETAAIHNTENSIYALERFRRLGVRIAIDDFGTGYSSLSYLKRLPVDTIKIDRSFVNGLPGDEKDAALCELLLQMSERFDIAALAEGIETEEQLTWLRDHGCRFGQGFLVAKPLPLEALATLLLRRPARVAS